MTAVEVAVLAPLFQTYTYSINDKATFSSDDLVALIGRRVMVPLGRRSATGYILGAACPDPASSVVFKEIHSFLDQSPLFPSKMVPLFRWLADYYHYPIGEIIHLALPGGLARTIQKKLIVSNHTDICDDSLLSCEPENVKWLQLLRDTSELSRVETAALQATKAGKRFVSGLVEKGICTLQDSSPADKISEKNERVYSLAVPIPWEETWPDSPDNASLQKFKQILPESSQALKGQSLKAVYWLWRLGGGVADKKIARKLLVSAYPGSRTALPTLVAENVIAEGYERIFRSPFGDVISQFAGHTLTADQEAAALALREAVRKNQYEPFLLHGVTGSGKTEIYLNAAEYAINLGKDVLVLVPEIALATQLEEQFLARFGQQVALLHSGLSSAERYDQWSLILLGQAKLVIGARSAVFAPLSQLGLIIVDEEHDSGFKQDDSLRYHARDVAVMRAKIESAVVVLASATPSVTSYYNALNGKYSLLSLPKRIADRPLPDVHLIDLTQKNGVKRGELFRKPLLTALQHNLMQGKQSVILLNRRGFSTSILCQECGAPVECAHCRVSLTWHKGRNTLLCHYCGYSCHPQTICNQCGSMVLAPIGFGTERVEEELTKLFPDARLARIDADTAGNRKYFLAILQKMRSGEIDILIGTQMIAKGHHFPNVTLVGVVLADGGLNLPDFRSAEKTFQLITQVIGRAGRGESPGNVYIQTYRPDHYAIRYARDHHYQHFVEKELELRKKPAFPPYVRLAIIHIQGEKSALVQECSELLAKFIKGKIGGITRTIALLGPAPSPIERLRNNHRWQIMLKATDLQQLHELCRNILEDQSSTHKGSVRISIDIDPENML